LGEQIFFPYLIARERLDLFFAPHFNVPFLCFTPFVATIHDLILHRYPNNASLFRRLAYRLLMVSTVRRAQRLIAVSTFTAQEIASVYGEALLEKTEVIPEASSTYFRRPPPATIDSVLRQYGVERPYIVYVGNAKQHKNLQLLLQAHRALGDGAPSLVLVCSGPEAMRLSLHGGVRIVSDVPDALLPAFYAGAQCFVTPTLYEGFCLPLHEATACGCPVIALRTPAMESLAPEGCVLTEPTVSALTAALQSPPTDAPHTVRRTWADVADDTLALVILAQF
jgi:glycosyltransferase involved in cell wall biosynthesis